MNNKVSIFVRGCRSPQSKGSGHWDGAFVFGFPNDNKEENKMVTSAFFEEDHDYIGTGKIDDIIEIYKNLVHNGWVDMVLDDIIKTSGLNGKIYEF